MHITIPVIDLSKWPKPNPGTPNHIAAMKKNQNNRSMFYEVIVEV